jgi:hypothetical protein
MELMKYLNTAITKPSYVTTTAWLEHGPFATWLIRKLKPNRVVELGTHYGYSYFAMCEAVLADGLPTQCFAVDTWEGDQHARFYDDSVYNGVLKENAAYSEFSHLPRCTFSDALADIEDGSVDLLHVDGRHFYDDVKEDFESWIPKLSKSAVVLFHDTTVFERGFGVHKYWDEISRSRPSTNFHHGHGLGILFWGETQSDAAKEVIDQLETPGQEGVLETVFGAIGDAFAKQCECRDVANQLNSLREEVEQLRMMKGSISWRVTRPLRAARRLMMRN